MHSLDEMAEKENKSIEENPDKMIRHLWFDSHGKYEYGHALFNIGRDTISADNINDPNFRRKLEQITAYYYENSKLRIDACYTVATFSWPAKISLRKPDV